NTMTELLAKAFAEASKLPVQDQDALAALILEELASERRWEEAFASSPQVLTQLADEALEEHHKGQTHEQTPTTQPLSRVAGLHPGAISIHDDFDNPLLDEVK